MQKVNCFLTGSTDLSDKLDIIRIEVNPSEKYKSVSLTKTLNLKGQGRAQQGWHIKHTNFQDYHNNCIFLLQLMHSSSIHYCLLNKEKTMFNRSEVCQFLFNALLLLGYKLSCTWILFQMVLAGKRPEIIMEICSRAMSFWSYQVLAIKIIVFYPTKNPPPSPIEGWLIICRLALFV